MHDYAKTSQKEREKRREEKRREDEIIMEISWGEGTDCLLRGKKD
jgi:hypothetical protein